VLPASRGMGPRPWLGSLISLVVTEDSGAGDVDRVGTGARSVLAFVLTWAGLKAGGADPALAGLGAASGAGAMPYADVWWARLRKEWRRDQEDNIRALNIVTAGEAGWSDEELGERAGRSQATRMLYGMAAEAAAKTPWPPKVIAIGRVLASGLSADGDDIELAQYAVAAMSEMERIHVELLELLVKYQSRVTDTNPASGGLRFEAEPCTVEPQVLNAFAGATPDWIVGPREWPEAQIGLVRPKLKPVLAGITGTLESFGLASRTDRIPQAIEQLAKDRDEMRAQMTSNPRPGMRPPRLSPARPVTARYGRIWTPTELGEQILGYYIEAAEQADASQEGEQLT
jgi:hypothetical protein